ncbi:MAG: HAMP domain-containing sensor histidine kinase [Cytophagales bacterium]|nr:HAMP domain-containing sensor histidine kinase [Cytophagales bacterium]
MYKISKQIINNDSLTPSNMDMLVFDNEYHIEYLSKEFCKKFNIDAKKVVGKHISVLNPHYLPKKTEIFNKKNNFRNINFAFETPNNALRNLLLNGFIYKNDKKKYAFAFWNDVTEQESYKKRFIHSEMELNTLIYKISHDLRGPVATMKGLINVMNLEKKDCNITYHNFIDQQLTKLDTSIHELTKVSDLSIGKLNINSDVDIHKEVYETLQIASHKYNLYNAVYQFNINLLKPIRTNEYVIKSIFNNLWMYCFEDKSQQPNYNIMLDIILTDEAMLKIKLIHSGKRMSAEQVDKIFTPFYKINQAYNSSNLYLFTLKKYVDFLNGYIGVKYEANTGTIFEIELPVFVAK